MDILEFIQKNNKLAIYGAGQKGKELKRIFDYGNIDIECFLVTTIKNTEQQMLDGKRVCQFKDWMLNSSESHSAICVAVSSMYVDDIISELEPVNIPYYLLQNEDYSILCRYFNPVKTEKFLMSSEPVSNVFGFDRGLPIDRWYIETFLQERALKLNHVVRTLEVGEDFYSKKFFSEEGVARDILQYEKGMDLTKWETLSENTYDVFIATQVFNFIYDVKKAIGGAYRLLKEGGTLLATVAGNISQVSWVDMNDYGDYWRFTDLSIKQLMQEWFDNDVWVEPFGNAAVATAFVQGLAVEDLPNREILIEKDRAYSICIGIMATKR